MGGCADLPATSPTPIVTVVADAGVGDKTDLVEVCQETAENADSPISRLRRGEEVETIVVSARDQVKLEDIASSVEIATSGAQEGASVDNSELPNQVLVLPVGYSEQDLVPEGGGGVDVLVGDLNKVTNKFGVNFWWATLSFPLGVKVIKDQPKTVLMEREDLEFIADLARAQKFERVVVLVNNKSLSASTYEFDGIKVAVVFAKNEEVVRVVFHEVVGHGVGGFSDGYEVWGKGGGWVPAADIASSTAFFTSTATMPPDVLWAMTVVYGGDYEGEPTGVMCNGFKVKKIGRDDIMTSINGTYRTDGDFMESGQPFSPVLLWLYWKRTGWPIEGVQEPSSFRGNQTAFAGSEMVGSTTLSYSTTFPAGSRAVGAGGQGYSVVAGNNEWQTDGTSVVGGVGVFGAGNQRGEELAVAGVAR